MSGSETNETMQAAPAEAAAAEPTPGPAPEAPAQPQAKEEKAFVEEPQRLEPIPTRAPARDEAPELEDEEPAALEQAEDEEQDTPFDKLVTRARRFSPDRVRTILESLLFVTDKPLSEEAMRQATGIEVPVIHEQLEKLQGTYRDGVRGIVLHEVAGGWQFRTDPGCAEFVRRFLKVKPQRLTRAALETLAIIAYRQPVTRPEIEDVRAVDCGAVLKALLERRLIKIIGKKEEPGRPLLYGTTTEFLEFFNLRDLGSLPTLREFQELSEESQEIVEKETGTPEPKPDTKGLVAALKDNTFEAKLSESNAEADAALAELETAMFDSESKAKQTARMLDPQAPEGEPGAVQGELPFAGTPPFPPAGGEAEDEPEDEPRGRADLDDDEDDGELE